MNDTHIEILEIYFFVFHHFFQRLLKKMLELFKYITWIAWKLLNLRVCHSQFDFFLFICYFYFAAGASNDYCHPMLHAICIWAMYIETDHMVTLTTKMKKKKSNKVCFGPFLHIYIKRNEKRFESSWFTFDLSTSFLPRHKVYEILIGLQSKKRKRK